MSSLVAAPLPLLSVVQPPSALKEGGEWNDLPFLTSLQSVGQRIHCIILNRESYSVLYCMYVCTE